MSSSPSSLSLLPSNASSREKRQDLDRIVQARPSNNSSQAIVIWIVSIVTSICAWIDALSSLLSYRIQDSIDNNETSVEGMVAQLDDLRQEVAQIAVVTRTATATATARASPATKGTSSSGRDTRCGKCHARGHTADNCRSTNPSAVHRRIAQNAKARARACQPPVPPLGQYLPASTIGGYTIPNAVLSLYIPTNTDSADAAELHRCIAQSNRDRRRNRATLSMPASKK